jgi:hypothetical protein
MFAVRLYTPSLFPCIYGPLIGQPSSGKEFLVFPSFHPVCVYLSLIFCRHNLICFVRGSSPLRHTRGSNLTAVHCRLELLIFCECARSQYDVCCRLMRSDGDGFMAAVFCRCLLQRRCTGLDFALTCLFVAYLRFAYACVLPMRGRHCVSDASVGSNYPPVLRWLFLSG